MATEAYPLSWPQGWKRTHNSERKNGKFRRRDESWIGVGAAVDRVLNELRRMGVDRSDVIISTNLRTRLDGLPSAQDRKPLDPGAAVYWRAGSAKTMMCMPIDIYTEVADNLAAIAATLEAMRAIERHGGGEILERAYTGFKALSAENAGESWWKTLQISPEATEKEINDAYKKLAKFAHPDVPSGSNVAMSALNIARDQGLNVAKHRI